MKIEQKNNISTNQFNNIQKNKAQTIFNEPNKEIEKEYIRLMINEIKKSTSEEGKNFSEVDVADPQINDLYVELLSKQLSRKN